MQCGKASSRRALTDKGAPPQKAGLGISDLSSFCRLHKKGLSPPQPLKSRAAPTGIDPIAPGVHDPSKFEVLILRTFHRLWVTL